MKGKVILLLYSYIVDNNHSPAEQEQLRVWYRTYYNDNKEKERERHREYYSLHSDSEKERVKKAVESKKLNLNQIP